MNILHDYNSLNETIKKNPYIKTGIIIAGGIIGVWVLGKATLLLADATKNFKVFYNEIK